MKKSINSLLEVGEIEETVLSEHNVASFDVASLDLLVDGSILRRVGRVGLLHGSIVNLGGC